MQAPMNQVREEAATPEQNIATFAVGWLTSLRSRVYIAAELALAEAKLAAISLATMIFLATLAAILLLSAWGLFVAGAVHGLLQTGLPLWAILPGIAVVHLLAAALLVQRALSMTANMNFSETRQHVGPSAEVTS